MARTVTRRKRRGKRSGGRRANYAPAASELGIRKYLPITWANWLGFALFGLIAIALAAETISAVVNQQGNDWIPALFMTVVFVVMAYLFSTTRTKDF